MNKVVFVRFASFRFLPPRSCINSLSCWCVGQCCRRSTISFLYRFEMWSVWGNTLNTSWAHIFTSDILSPQPFWAVSIFIWARWDGSDRMQKYTIVSKIKQTQKEKGGNFCLQVPRRVRANDEAKVMIFSFVSLLLRPFLFRFHSFRQTV